MGATADVGGEETAVSVVVERGGETVARAPITEPALIQRTKRIQRETDLSFKDVVECFYGYGTLHYESALRAYEADRPNETSPDETNPDETGPVETDRPNEKRRG